MTKWTTRAVMAAIVLSSAPVAAQNDFIRGDADCNGVVNFIDAVDISRILFLGVPPSCNCPEARDSNDDGLLSIIDSITLLNFIVLAGPPPPSPFPLCGPDPTGPPLGCVGYPSPCPLFKRGDANQDGCVSVDDATFVSNFLFTGGPAPLCMLAADANDDDIVDIQDVTYIANFCSTGGPPSPAPGPLTCGADPTPGVLTCGSYPASACGSGCRNQLPNDCNQDGNLDIADPVCLFGNLFAGVPPVLPCGDGSSGDPRNILFLDANGDFTLDISDGVYFLVWMFVNGPPPAQGTSCAYFQGCPQNAICPDCTP